MEKPDVLNDEEYVVHIWDMAQACCKKEGEYTVRQATLNWALETLELKLQQARQDTAREIISQIKEFLNKPQYYHFRCWGSGVVLIRDEWGDEPTHQCHSYDGDFNCGCRRCPWENGIIEGTPELQDFERHQNSIIGEIVLSLKSKFLIPPNPVGSADV